MLLPDLLRRGEQRRATPSDAEPAVLFDSVFEYWRGTAATSGHPGTLPTRARVAAGHRTDVLGAVRVRPGTGRPRRSRRGPLPGRLRRRPVSGGMDGAAAYSRPSPRASRPPPARLPVARSAKAERTASLGRSGRLGRRDPQPQPGHPCRSRGVRPAEVTSPNGSRRRSSTPASTSSPPACSRAPAAGRSPADSPPAVGLVYIVKGRGAYVTKR